MKKDIKSYSNSQGKVAKLLLTLGIMNNKRSTHAKLNTGLKMLKEELLKEDPALAEKIANIKRNRASI